MEVRGAQFKLTVLESFQREDNVGRPCTSFITGRKKQVFIVFYDCMSAFRTPSNRAKDCSKPIEQCKEAKAGNVPQYIVLRSRTQGTRSKISLGRRLCCAMSGLLGPLGAAPQEFIRAKGGPKHRSTRKH